MTKKILTMIAALVMCATTWAVDYYMAGNGTASNNWCCGKNWEPAGCKMTSGSYSATVPAGTYKFKVTNGTWNGCWGYSSVDGTKSTKGYVNDDDGNVNFTVAANATIDVSFNGSKITLTSTVPFSEYTSWTVVGDESLLGVSWDPTATANDMKYDTLEGNFLLTKSGKWLAAGNYEYKIVANHTWSKKEIPAQGNDTLTIAADGFYDVKFTLDTDGTKSTVVATPSTSLQVKIITSMGVTAQPGEQVTLVCETTIDTAEMSLKMNGVEVKNGKGKQMTYTGALPTTLGTCQFQLTAKVVVGERTKTRTTSVSTFVCDPVVEEARPSGLQAGITYDKNNPTTATLCMFAAGCKNADDPSVLEPAKTVYVVGDFNSWKLNSKYQMKRDGNYFWIKLTGLAPQQEYAFQYYVVRADGKEVKISDLYSTRLKENASGASGYATVLQTNAPAYTWSEASKSFVRPDKNNLVIYELWVYDHTANHNFKGLMKKMDYFSQLGVNCIELMPVNEFDGDQSWGYAPNHYFAVDKQYGTMDEFKAFIDSCHSRGIAVVMDMVFNHSTGNNPMEKLYPYGEDLKYNPWFNTSAPHPDNVYEDWNHDFPQTHEMVMRAMQYWMDEFKVDGYRLDLSHGLCGKSYNAVYNLKDYYHKAVEPRGGYMMLEHWGEKCSQEWGTLVNEGMMCWSNTCNTFFQTGMGWLKDGDDFKDANRDGYVSYPENHDEERTFFKVKMYGDGDLKTNINSRAARIPLNLGFQCMLNGPQLFYHFTEVGSEIGKFQNKSFETGKMDGGEVCAYEASSCKDKEFKMDPKEAYRMSWSKDTSVQMQAMRKVGKIIQLRTRYMPRVFEGNPTASDIGSGKALRYIRWGDNALIVGNFSAKSNQVYTLPGGTWYDYLNGSSPAKNTYTVKPGEIYVFINQPVVGINQTHENLQNIARDLSMSKVVLNGKIYIIRDNKMYDLMGNLVR